jgi:hypothetical protein
MEYGSNEIDNGYTFVPVHEEILNKFQTDLNSLRSLTVDVPVSFEFSEYILIFVL